LDEQIEKTINKHREFKGRYDAITNVKGVGKVTAYSFIAEISELGNIGKREVAALVWVAPMNCGSGRKIGKRRTEGGRIRVCNALYMEVFSDIVCNPGIRDSIHLREESCKLVNVAAVACMRKLILHINRICSEK
jgi:transposase